MYDTLTCDYPLPGDSADVQDWSFQTKDLDEEMYQYRITEDGQLMERRPKGEMERPVNHTGDIEFYSSNAVAMGPGVYTANGEDYRHVAYVARFRFGKLTQIEQMESTRQPALKRRNVPEVEAAIPLTDAMRNKPSLMGERIYIQWGGESSKPYSVHVVAQSGRDLAVIRDDDEQLEIFPRWQLGNCGFASAEEREEHDRVRKAEWQRGLDEYNAEVARRKVNSQ